MAEFTAEQLAAAKAAKSPEELLAMAKDAGVEMTLEQAEQFLHPATGEISEEELANVAGGDETSSGHTIVTVNTECIHGREITKNNQLVLRHCSDDEAGSIAGCAFLKFENPYWACTYYER